jgi:tetratricopeptide (TPR) repeat protein
MSLQLDAELFPLHDSAGGTLPNPVVFHAQNLFWHTATVVLLFAVLRRMTGAFWPSAMVAALFAVHPLHVESVAWATERKDVLSTFFWVLTMLAYFHWTRARTPLRYFALLAAFVLGLLAKPMLVTLPCVLLLLDAWPLRRLRWPAAVLEKLPLFALAAGASWLTVITQRQGDAVVPQQLLPVSERLANAVVSVGWYLEKTFWPTQLAVFYPHPEWNWSWPTVVSTGAGLLAVTLMAVVLARSRPWLLVGWLWFLGTLVPILGLLQVGAQGRADRFTYLPHIGLFLVLVWSVAELLPRRRLGVAGSAVLSGAWLAVLAAVAWVQVGYWHDSLTIWRHALTVTTDNHRAHAALARLLGKLADQENNPQLVRDYLGEARVHAEKAVALRSSPEYLSRLECVGQEPGAACVVDLQRTEYLYVLGMVCWNQGELDRAEEAFSGAASGHADHADTWYMLGLVCLRQGTAGKLERAEGALEKALEVYRQASSGDLSPADRDRRIAETLAHLGFAHWQLGQRERGEACWRAALELNPAEALALNGQGLLLLRRGQLEAAINRFTSAVQVNPGMAPAHSNRGVALCRLNISLAERGHATAIALEEARLATMTEKGRTFPSDLALYRRRRAYSLRVFYRDDEAARDYREALRLDPGWPRRCLAEAWRLAADPDPDERDPATAVELASEVCQASANPSSEALDALAAAQAAAGLCTEAVKTARRALVSAESNRARRDIQLRLALYEQGKAYVRDSRRLQDR